MTLGPAAQQAERYLAASRYDGVPALEHEALGEFGDRCEAIEAYRKALREDLAFPPCR